MAERKKRGVTCAFCATAFQASSWRATYCTLSCRDKHKRRLRRPAAEGQCKRCGEAWSYRPVGGRKPPALCDPCRESHQYCHPCSTVKPLAEFAARNHSINGRSEKCKECGRRHAAEYRAKNPGYMRGYHLGVNYGMTPEEWANLSARQDGRCAICQRETTLVVDHCHTSGQVRALLCNPCNGALGLMKDSPDTLLAAAAYLLQYADVLATTPGGETPAS